MKAQALPDAFQVYLHCHTIFDGQSAQIRNLKKVTQILLQNKKSLAGLTIAFTIPDIASVATQLLKDRIFESQHLAIQRFPKLLTPLTPKDTEPAPAQIESSKSETNAGQGEAQDSGNRKRKGSKGQDDKSADLDVEQGLDSKGCEDAYDSASDPCFQQHAIPELDPVYFPFKTQHVLLTTLQRMLEECCFDFGHHWVPDQMKKNGWREVESLELTQWTQWFVKNKPAATTRPIEGKSIAVTLSAIGVIRHTAVHRVRTSADEILDMVDAAETFANMLYDESKVMELRQIKTELSAKLQEIRLHKTTMKRKLTERLEDIARRRADLDRLENAYVEDFRVTDEKHRKDAGAAIEAYLNEPQKSEPLDEFKEGNSFDESEKGEYSDELETGEFSELTRQRERAQCRIGGWRYPELFQGAPVTLS